MSLVAVTLDTVMRCKICASPKRVEIDQLICAQRNGELSQAQLLETMAALGLANPNKENIKSHTGTKAEPKHVKFVPQVEVEEARQVMEEEAQKLQAGEFEPVDPDQLLQLQLKAYERWLAGKIAAGEDVHLTHDHAIKIVAEMTKRRHNQAQNEILGALTGGIAKALGASGALGELPAGDEIVVDAEDVRVEDVDGG